MLRSKLRLLFVATAFVLFFAVATESAASDTWTEPEPGISRLHRTASGPLSIHAAVVDLCDPTLELRATKPSEGPRTTSGWGSLVGARVAINGDFYNTANHQPIGLAMGDRVHWPGTFDDSSWALVAAGRDGVVEIRPAAEALGSNPEYWMREIVGGNPNCLVQGVPRSSSASHYGDLHPRSGIGISEDGSKLVFVVIDGRRPGVSIGATTLTLGQTLNDLGAWEGLNFDGGGSSTLWLASDGVVNQPSGGSERTVANHFGVVRVEVPPGEPSRCCRPEAVSGATGTFDDVRDTHFAIEAIEALYDEGITSGCSANPPFFCPGCRTYRGQAIAFLMRGSGHDLTPPSTATFSDVPTSHPFFAEVEAAVREGVTSGCGGGRFCPDQPASRDVVAIFAARAMGLEITSPSTAPFSDVPADHFAAGAIKALVDACAASGCAADMFCPDRTTTRAELAAITARLAGLVPTSCDPDDPTEPGDPDDPTEPGDPDDPTEPGDPDDPTEPGDPDDPAEPGDPDDPENPDGSDELDKGPGGVDVVAGSCACTTSNESSQHGFVLLLMLLAIRHQRGALKGSLRV